jgi:hypothetical protein
VIKLKRGFLLLYTILFAALFYVLLQIFGLNTLIAVLNGACIGALLAITVTYSRVMRSWFFGYDEATGVSMFGLFFVLLWAVIGLFVFNSIYLRAADEEYTALLTTAIGRYVLIISAWGLIASLDYGETWFYGRDRKLLYAGVTAGTLIAAILIWAQQYRILS